MAATNAARTKDAQEPTPEEAADPAPAEERPEPTLQRTPCFKTRYGRVEAAVWDRAATTAARSTAWPCSGAIRTRTRSGIGPARSTSATSCPRPRPSIELLRLESKGGGRRPTGIERLDFAPRFRGMVPPMPTPTRIRTPSRPFARWRKPLADPKVPVDEHRSLVRPSSSRWWGTAT